MAANFRAGGLASGMDTNAIIDSLIALQRRPIEKLAAAQKIVDVKVSTLGSLTSKLEAFKTAVAGLASGGARGLTVAQSPTGLAAAVTAGSEAGVFSVQVLALAQAAKARTVAFPAGEVVRGGSLHIDADGVGFDVTFADSASLEEVTAAIRASGAPVSASIINDGTQRHLLLTRSITGFAIGTAATTALSITESSSGSNGQPLGFTNTLATNARVSIDGLSVERRSNEIGDALAGTTLTLKQVTTSAESLVVSDDTAATKVALQKVVDSYNAVIGLVQFELAIGADIDRAKTLGGEPTLKIVQMRMQSLLVGTVGTGDVRSLADLGVRSARDGKLSIDAATFTKVMTKEPTAVDKLLDGGLSASVGTIVDAFTGFVDGTITLRSKSLADEKKRLGERMAVLELRVEREKELLIARFTAMEKIVSSLKSTGSFLTSQSNAQEKS